VRGRNTERGRRIIEVCFGEYERERDNNREGKKEKGKGGVRGRCVEGRVVLRMVGRHAYWVCVLWWACIREACGGGLLLRAHVSVGGARCGGLVLGRRVVVGLCFGLYWEDVL
jgi:hypothetical protein